MVGEYLATSAQAATQEFRDPSYRLEGPFEGTPVLPTEADLVAVAAASGVAIDEINPSSVGCWQREHTRDTSKFWVSIFMHWCVDAYTTAYVSSWGYTTQDVNNSFTQYLHGSGAICGPSNGPGEVRVRCHANWTFCSSNVINGACMFTYNPWMTGFGNWRGYAYFESGQFPD